MASHARPGRAGAGRHRNDSRPQRPRRSHRPIALAASAGQPKGVFLVHGESARARQLSAQTLRDERGWNGAQFRALGEVHESVVTRELEGQGSAFSNPLADESELTACQETPCMKNFHGCPVAANRQAILESPSYRLAEYDVDFLRRNENRPLRMQLELLKTETLLREHHIDSTVVVFGGTQIVPREQAEAAASRSTAQRARDRPTIRAGPRRQAGRAHAGQEPLLRRGPRVQPARFRRRASGRPQQTGRS